MRLFKRSHFVQPAAVVAGSLLLAACGSSASKPSGMSGMNMPGISRPSSPVPAPSSSPMPGMDMDEPMPTGDGLAATAQGSTLVPASATVGGPTSDGFRFKILDASSGKAVTKFQDDQTKQMHFYLIRSDLSGFQHVHPTMAADGTWTAPLASAAPGSYRAYASFIAAGSDGAAVAPVLSVKVNVPGSAAPTALPAASTTTSVDGYTVTVSGSPMAGMAMPLKASISKDGAPVRNLQPYLATYAHLSAFHAGDLAFAHLHPQGAAATTDTGGPDLTFEATFPSSGDWRVFLQFQTGGTLHTAAITVDVR
jgi:hypothetical protein